MIIIAHGDTAVLAIVAPGAVLTVTVGLCFVPVLAISHILAGAEHVAVGCFSIGREIYTHVDDGLSLLTFLGRNDDNTTGGLSTIDGSR